MADRRAGLAARVPVAAVFVVLGVTVGTWAARIPAVKSDLHLSTGVLGLTLLGPALGSVLAMPLTGALLATVPPRRVVQCGLLALAGFLPVTTFATSAWQLFAVLAGWGAGLGVVDVGINTEASAVQDRLGRPVMSGFHAAYSVGGLAGAGLGGIAAATGVSPRTDFFITAVVVLVAGLASAQRFAAVPAHAEPESGAAAGSGGAAGGGAAAESGAAAGADAGAGAGAAGDGSPWPAGRPAPASTARRRPPVARWPRWSWALVCLAVMSFASFLAEGSASDWSAVYLHSSLGASAGLAALGYTVFSCTMTAGRLAGDKLASRLGPARLVRLSAGLAAVGFGVALLIGRTWSGLAGFAVLGAGLSVVVPLVFSAAAGLGRPGPNLAAVTSSGYLGMLAGPPIIGGVAQLIGLPEALGMVVVLCLLIAVLAGVIRSREAPGPDLPPSAQEILFR